MPRARTRSTGIVRRARRRRAPADTGGAEVVIRSAAPADEAAIDRLSDPGVQFVVRCADGWRRVEGRTGV